MASPALVATLGGKRAVGPDLATNLDFDHAIREGFRWTVVQHLKDTLHLSNRALAELTGTSEKTVERWFKRRDRIPPAASDKLFRVATIIALAEEVLNDPEQAREWLDTAQHGLAGRRPLDLLATSAGAREVESLLERMRHGFYA